MVIAVPPGGPADIALVARFCQSRIGHYFCDCVFGGVVGVVSLHMSVPFSHGREAERAAVSLVFDGAVDFFVFAVDVFTDVG